MTEQIFFNYPVKYSNSVTGPANQSYRTQRVKAESIKEEKGSLYHIIDFGEHYYRGKCEEFLSAQCSECSVQLIIYSISICDIYCISFFYLIISPTLSSLFLNRVRQYFLYCRRAFLSKSKLIHNIIKVVQTCKYHVYIDILITRKLFEFDYTPTAPK